ncbi:hypothetical protein P3T29_004305 [Kitasatospora sp. MAP5-34]|nr:hypothetical protein [Kitasatospora sp. MAP5-34]
MTMNPDRTAVRLPATAGQTSMFFAEQRAPSASAYNAPTVMHIRGPVTDSDLAAAGQRLIRLTPGLRARFGIDPETGGVVQWISREVPGVETVELPGLSPEALADYAVSRAGEPFESDEGALARVIAVRLGGDRAALIAITHHLVYDGVGYLALVRRMGDAVAGSLVGQDEAQHLDLVRRVVAGERAARDEDAEHWHQRVPLGIRPAPWESGDGDSAADDGRRLVPLTAAQTARLRHCADEIGTGLFAYLIAAVHRAMPVASGDPTYVCAAASVRPREGDWSDVLGYFVNEVPLRADSRDAPLGELAKQNADLWRADLRRRTFPFTDLAGRTAPGRDARATRLNSVMASYVRLPDVMERESGGVAMSTKIYPRYPSAKNDLGVRFFQRPDHLDIEVQWGRSLPAGLGRRFTHTLTEVLTESRTEPRQEALET